jgi:hypothetical protein
MPAIPPRGTRPVDQGCASVPNQFRLAQKPTRSPPVSWRFLAQVVKRERSQMPIALRLYQFKLILNDYMLEEGGQQAVEDLLDLLEPKGWKEDAYTIKVSELPPKIRDKLIAELGYEADDSILVVLHS